MTGRWLFSCAMFAVFSGCASSDVAPSFERLRSQMSSRVGAAPELISTEDEARAVHQRIVSLLAQPLDERAAVEITLLQEPRIQAELERLGIAQADLARATRIANPIFSWARLGLRGGGGAQESFGVELPFLDILVQPLRRKLGALEVERVRYEVGDMLAHAAAEARRAVIEAQAAEQWVERLEELAAIDAAAADYAQTLFEAGNVSALEVARHRAAFAERSLEVSEARGAALHARERVNRALGLSGDQIAWTLPSGGLPSVEESSFEALPLDGLERRAVSERLDLAAARAALEVMDQAIALERRTRFSPIGIDVGVETEREVDGARITGPTLKLQIPIFDTGKASLARLAAERRQMSWQLEALAVAARSEVRSSHADWIAAIDRLRFLRTALVPLSQQIVDLELRRYNMMLAGTFDLLLAKQREIEAEKRALRALADAWLARVDLEAALGGPLSNQEGDLK